MTTRLAHVVDGPEDAPVVLMGSSLGTDRRMWRHASAVLARRYRVVRYEIRGHGATPTPEATSEVTLDDLGADVVALMDELRIDRAHHVGLSIGGMLASWTAQHHPERVDRLVIACSSSVTEDPGPWRERAATVREHGIGAVVDAVLANWFTEAFDDAEAVADLRAAFLACDPEGYAQCCDAIATMDLRPGLGRIAAPTLVVAGAQDRATPVARSEETVAGIRAGGGEARLEIVEGAAHIAAVEEAGTVTGLVTEHLDAARTDVARGQATRRAVLGDAHVDRARARQSALDTDFQDLITRYAWGDIWSRPGLDRRTRSAITLTVLAALGHEGEFAMHVRAALRNGLTVDEVREVLLQVGLYAGVPVSNRAFALASEVLREEGLLEP